MKKQSRIFLILVLTAALLAAAMFFAAAVGKPTSPSSGHSVHGDPARYQCPMHPQVISDKPGDCPICHMRLVPIETTPSPSAAAQDPNAVCVLHECPMEKNGEPCPMLVLAEKGEKIDCPVCGGAIETGPRKVLFYRHPMRPEVSSPVPTKDEMGMDYLPVYGDEVDQADSGKEARALPTGYASVLISPERQQLIGIRTAPVEKREAVKKIRAAGRIAYDPDFYQAQSEVIESYKSLANAQKSGDPAAVEWTTSLVESAKTKLIRMGLNPQVIEALSRQEGPDKSLLYAVPGGSAWVYANVYEYEIPWVKVQDTVNVDVSSSPGKTIQGVIRAIDTVVDPATRTVRVRALVKNEEGLFKPDMYVNVWLETGLGKAILVPEEAVFFTGQTNLVFVDKGKGLFEPRHVTLGPKADNAYVVDEGLSEGEGVVTNGNFLIDSESKLKSALSSIGGHSHEG
ncbi:MAG: efflux RND transporter periplasmic adaptor subunit [Candidatus Omnitrophica bacterium]|nr:efflux RND transporter periplasmic adaptor subunit [Candidatus Omnitrophota bacterium]